MEENNKQISAGRLDLRGFRVGNGLLQKELAEYLGVSIAFISAVERGANRLPEEQLLKIVENDRDWDVDYLFGKKKTKSEMIRNEYQTFNNNGVSFAGGSHAPVNNYSGYSEEAFQKELARRMELRDQEVRALKEENERLRMELARERSTSDRYLAIIEKIQGPAPSVDEKTAGPND